MYNSSGVVCSNCVAKIKTAQKKKEKKTLNR